MTHDPTLAEMLGVTCATPGCRHVTVVHDHCDDHDHEATTKHLTDDELSIVRHALISHVTHARTQADDEERTHGETYLTRNLRRHAEVCNTLLAGKLGIRMTGETTR